MKKKNKILIALSAALLIIMTACVDKDFDTPDINEIPYDPDKVLTISQLKEFATDGQSKRFEEDYSVFATVVMDDKSGNIYRSAFVQDATGGINLRLMSPGAIYQGDYVRINLRNTTVNQYMSLFQIDSVDVDKNVQKLATWACETTIWGDPKPVVEPETVTISLIESDAFQSQLIRLENVEFAYSELGDTYGDTVNQFTSVNRTLMDCNGNSIIVRTSGFANFADEILPEGNGSVIAIASRYRDDYQLLIRSTNDVDMQGDRCTDDGSGNIITIQEIRDLYAGGTTILPPNVAIEAVVVSDYENGNIHGLSAVIMDDSEAGIVARFSTSHDYALGSKIRISAGQLELSEFSGLLQVGVPIGNATYLGSGTLPAPFNTTINEVLSNMEQYESTLVTFNNVTITGSSTYTGNLTISDGTNNITAFIRNEATFNGEPVPTGEVTLTGIVSVFNSPQFIIRNLNDVVE